MCEIMAYWDEDQPGWDDAEREYAEVWRAQPKYVVSRTLKSVGPNATLISDDVENAVRRLKSELTGEVSVTGPRPPLRLTTSERIGESVIRLTYVPA